MSWIKVRKDNIELLVSHESYKDLFSKQGYDIVLENPKPAHIPIPKEIKIEKEPKNNELHGQPKRTKNSNSRQSQEKDSLCE